MSNVEHNVANNVIVQAKGCLLWKFGQKANKLSNDLKGFHGFVSRQLLHKVFEKQIAVFYQARPNNLKRGEKRHQEMQRESTSQMGREQVFAATKCFYGPNIFEGQKIVPREIFFEIIPTLAPPYTVLEEVSESSSFLT